MTIHIFNPDHDLALAANLSNFTAPHAGRQLRDDLGFIPALWAEDGDIILVEDADTARNAIRKLKLTVRTDVRFETPKTLHNAIAGCHEELDVMPWGWNKTLRATLIRYGVPSDVMPDEETLDLIRELSGRHNAVELLSLFDGNEGVIGYSEICHSYDDVMRFLSTHIDIVVKAPWSSSGRGVRYIDPKTLTDNVQRWIHNTLKSQGFVVAEKKCQKVMDFAVEYISEKDGSVHPCGLSLFRTANAAYTGNILEEEEKKQEMLAQYLSPPLLNQVTEKTADFLAKKIRGKYCGPLGVDMMVCAKADNSGFMLNPCIEINLRRTMGHVALAISSQGQRGNMAVEYEGKSYKLKIQANG